MDKNALQAAYQNIKGMIFWQYFLDKLDEKKAYLTNLLIKAKSWEDVQKYQNELECISFIESLWKEIEK